MFPKSKVTEIYCMTDDFCKEFSFQQEKYMIEDKKIGHRNKPNRMSDAEMMVILTFYIKKTVLSYDTPKPAVLNKLK